MKKNLTQIILFTASLFLVFNLNAQNTKFGTGALLSNTTGIGNSAFGFDALRLNTIGNVNTAVGGNALKSNTTGEGNSAFGFQALFTNTIGNRNTAVGDSALRSNINGISNVAIGNLALWKNTQGKFNTAVGDSALTDNIVGSINTAVGNEALSKNTIGNSNTAVGVVALRSNINGHSNTAVGNAALYTNTTGRENAAIGANALANNTASSNTAVGYDGLSKNTTGEGNTATGYQSLSSNTSGFINVSSGYQSLNKNTTGAANTANGVFALSKNITGFTNTALGYFADVSQSEIVINNATALGAEAKVTASNNVVVGNTFVTKIGGFAEWSKLSDGNFKTEVNNGGVVGLPFIMELKPVTYHLNVRKLNDFLGVDKQKEQLLTEGKLSQKEFDEINRFNEESIKAKEAIVESGLIAQDVEKAAQKVGYNFNGVYKPAHSKDLYAIAYADLIPSMIKGMQEQQKQIEELKQLVERLTSQLKSTSTSVELNTKATVSQNVPNPFTDGTTIAYNTSLNAGKVQIAFYNMNGQQVKVVNVPSGTGSLKISAKELNAGTYSYKLIIDGQETEAAKVMVRQ